MSPDLPNGCDIDIDVNTPETECKNNVDLTKYSILHEASTVSLKWYKTLYDNDNFDGHMNESQLICYNLIKKQGLEAEANLFECMCYKAWQNRAFKPIGRYDLW